MQKPHVKKRYPKKALQCLTCWNYIKYSNGRIFFQLFHERGENIDNIYKEKELQKDRTIRKFRIVQTEGKRQVEREADYYNLDVIISVGYRVKSQRGTQFRIWATQVPKNHLIKGYSINEKLFVKTEFFNQIII